MQAATNPETIPQKIKRAALARWKIETLTGVLGVDSLERQAQMSQANQEAENRWARKHLWGEQATSTDESTDTESESQDMARGGHILGDVTYPTPVVIAPPPPQPEKSSLLPALALAAATMIPTTGAAAGIIGYLLAQPKPPAQVQPVQPQEYEEFNLGLGRLEDYK
jgi:hypothetical protein